jgi:circadian clock protein KaiB
MAVSLKLYIMGQTPRSRRIVTDLAKVCQNHLQDTYNITVVDVTQCPEAAIADRVMVTPTLIRESPLPSLRLVGDLSNWSCLAQHLSQLEQ